MVYITSDIHGRKDQLDDILCDEIQETLKLESSEFGAVLICAVRYAMGRETYMPSLITEFIAPILPYINLNTLECINRDLSNPATYGGFGHEKIDAPIWVRFHARVQNELNIRLDQAHKHSETKYER
jgi:hypothetical protein